MSWSNAYFIGGAFILILSAFLEDIPGLLTAIGIILCAIYEKE